MTSSSWHEIVFHGKANTVGSSDGFQELWQDSQKILSQTGMRLRTSNILMWNEASFELYTQRAVSQTMFLWIDDVTVWTPGPSTAPKFSYGWEDGLERAGNSQSVAFPCASCIVNSLGAVASSVTVPHSGTWSVKMDGSVGNANVFHTKLANTLIPQLSTYQDSIYVQGLVEISGGLEVEPERWCRGNEVFDFESNGGNARLLFDFLSNPSTSPDGTTAYLDILNYRSSAGGSCGGSWFFNGAGAESFIHADGNWHSVEIHTDFSGS
jgi:hypothetical protein